MTISRLLRRQWRKRPGRALATVASVAVAVAAVVATWVAADASRAGYRRLAETVEGVPSIDISARGGGRFEATVLPKLADIPGVRAVVPLFFRPTLLRVGEKRVREVAVGVDAAALVEAGLLTLTSGRPCEAADEVVLDAALAEGLAKRIGDEVIMFARRSIRRMTVVGIADSQSLKWFAEGGGVVVDIQPLEEMSNAFGLVDRVRVVVAPGGSRPTVLAAVAKRLPATLAAEVPAGRAGMAEDVLHSANLGLDFVTGLTVAMAFFLVGNAMLMNVTERRRSFALLRVLGATGRQVERFVMAEAALLGAAGSVVGAAAGLAAAVPISAGISRTLQAPAASLVVHPLVIPAAIALGTLVAVAAAWWPAREAADVEPLAGLADAPPPPRGVSGRFLAMAVVMWAVSAVVMTLVVWEWLPPRAAVPAGILMMLAFVATTPIVLPTLCAACARLIPERWRIERTLAVEQIIRQPIRTALTTGVLVVAVSNAIGLGHAIRDNVDDVRGWYTRLMRADWMLTHAGMVSGGLAMAGPKIRMAEEEVRALTGVKRVEGIGVAAGRVAGGACVVVARDIPADTPLPTDPVGTTEADLRVALDRGEAAAGTVLARRSGIKPGDEVEVEVYGRTARVKIAALVVDYTSGGASLLLRRDVAARLFGLEAADIVLVTAEPGAMASLRDPLQRIAESHGMLLRSFENVQAFINGIVGGVVNSLWMILGLGFVVGSLGVANTVTMNVLEKTRTLGLLRAVGMTSGQVTRLVVLESVLLGVSGGLIGAVGGMCTALLIQLASQPLLGHPIRASLRPTVVAVNLVAAVAVTVLAAWIPARRAVHLDLLESISTE
ncbi:MAG: FtsX-like permease family protein [Planctomycetia bacterium]|nr:FtsX-like permease family protein [Planctomycetia bacterium]